MSLISRFVALFRTERLNRELEEEQEFHIACRPLSLSKQEYRRIKRQTSAA